MGLSVGEVKQNSNYNFNNATMGLGNVQRQLAQIQLDNYNKAKSLGANDDDDWDDWKDKI